MPKKKAMPVDEPEQVVTPGPAEQPEEAKVTTKRGKKAKEPPASPDETTFANAPLGPPAEGVTPPETVPSSEVDTGLVEASADNVGPTDVAEEPAPAPVESPRSDRRQFFGLDFHELDRDLTTEERQEWNSIYASYRGRSALSGTIIGVDRHTVTLRNNDTGEKEERYMFCAIVVPYRVRVVIPATEMWETGQERPNFVLQNMVGATIQFVITMVDRENGFAIASRRQAMRNERRFFARRPSLGQPGVHLKCRVLSVGPRRCLVECCGHDINLTQREMRYTAIPDLKNEYHPGQELECVVKSYDPDREVLKVSVKETEPNPFEGAAERHPVGCRRQATIAGKYAGGVFCNLPDNTVCLCSYSYQHEDSEFAVGDTVILVVQRFNFEKKQMYGKILSKW